MSVADEAEEKDEVSDMLLATLLQHQGAGETGVVKEAVVLAELGEEDVDADDELEEDIVEMGAPAAAATNDGSTSHGEGEENAEEEETDEYREKLTRSKTERQHLIAKNHQVTAGVVTWKVIESSVAPPLEEYEQVGVRQASFKDFKELKQSLSGPDKKLQKHAGSKDDVTKPKVYPYQNLFLALWPGNWRRQLKQLNEEIEKAQTNANGSRKKGIQVVQPVSRKEWWRFIALLIAAAVVGYGGERLWESHRSRSEEGQRQFCEPPDFGRYMPLRRFQEIRKFFQNSFYNCSRSSGNSYDPWWPVIGMIKAFNRRRQRQVLASILKVLDELMSAFVPRTSSLGGFPNISFILRKPEPLGTEFKVVCCGKTGIVINLEVQRGKAGMAKTYPEQREHGATAACTLRGATATQTCGQKPPHKRCLVYGDSWFASVKTVELLHGHGFSFVGPVKTAKKNYPKAFLEETMKDWSSGMSLVLEGRMPAGVEVLAIGYKYNATKVLCFVASKDAGSTLDGNPYHARFQDGFGNVATRAVSRPDIISRYFAVSNVVDKHNQARQFELALEKHWVTQSCWFWVVTTIIGVTVTDAWKAFKFNNGKTHTESELPVREFADRLVWELMDTEWENYNDFPGESDPEDMDDEDEDEVVDFSPPSKKTRSMSMGMDEVSAKSTMGVPPIRSISDQFQADILSEVTQQTLQAMAPAAEQQQQQQICCRGAAQQRLILDEHDVVDYSLEHDASTGRPKRGKCYCCRKNTATKCKQCNVPLCVMSVWQRERDCWRKYHDGISTQEQLETKQHADDGADLDLD